MAIVLLFMSSIIVLNYVCLIGADTSVTFKQSYNDDHLLLSNAMSMRCAVQTSSLTTRVPRDDHEGRYEIPRIPQRISHVISMIVKRDDIHIAMVTQNFTATALSDQGVMKVTADISEKPGNGYLAMSWPQQTPVRPGLYVCEVKAIDINGQRVVLNRTLEVDVDLYNLTEQVHDLHVENDAASNKFDQFSEDFEEEKDNTRDLINNVAKKINAQIQSLRQELIDLSTNVDAKNSVLGKRIDELTQRFDKMNTSLVQKVGNLTAEANYHDQITNARLAMMNFMLFGIRWTQNRNANNITTAASEIDNLKNVQTGTLEFYKSGDWHCCEKVGNYRYRYVDQTVHFKPEYGHNKPPAIQFGMIMSDTENDKEETVKAELINVNSKSFTLRVKTWLDSIVHGVQFRWISRAKDF